MPAPAIIPRRKPRLKMLRPCASVSGVQTSTITVLAKKDIGVLAPISKLIIKIYQKL